MQREIKFRAWNKIDEEMHPWRCLRRCVYNSDHVDVKDTDGFGRHNDIFKDPHLELMQYTGETDQDGKEVYEGDIVEASIYNKETPQTLTVEFRYGAFVIDYEDSESDCCVIGAFVGTLKIVGNIYEGEK